MGKEKANESAIDCQMSGNRTKNL